MDSALRPKDIQARIRAGESAESVAEAAQVPVERLMFYALPVLAERENVARLARESAVRRRHHGAPPRLLGDAVRWQLHSAGSDPEAVTWDAQRRGDGRWTVTADPAGDQPTGTYVFDLPGRFSVATDDAGRALVGDVPPPPRAEPEQPGTTQGPVAEPESAGSADPSGPGRKTGLPASDEPAAGSDPSDRAHDTAELPAAQTYVDEPVTGDGLVPEAGEDAEPGAQLSLDELTGGGEETGSSTGPRSEQRRRRERKRSSVPSWDEIMFGGKRDP